MRDGGEHSRGMGRRYYDGAADDLEEPDVVGSVAEPDGVGVIQVGGEGGDGAGFVTAAEDVEKAAAASDLEAAGGQGGGQRFDVAMGEDERFAKLAAGGEGGGGGREGGSFGDLLDRHLPESANGDAGGKGRGVQGGAGGGRSGSQDDVRFTGNDDRGAVLDDVGIGVAHLPAEGVDFGAGFAGNQDERDAIRAEVSNCGLRLRITV